jgi:ectoine hydroxylase
MSIALTDNHPYNGGLLLIPGSHRTFLPCAAAAEDHFPAESDLATLTAEHGIAQFTGPAGDALLFDANIMYGCAANMTPLPRSNIVVVFNSVANTVGEPYREPVPRPDFLACRDFTPIAR